MKKPKGQRLPYYKLLTRKLVLISIVVSFTPMLLVIAIILSQFSSSYHAKVQDHLKELVKNHKNTIDGFLKERLSDIRFLAQTIPFESLIAENGIKQQLRALQSQYHGEFEDLGVVDHQGVQIAYAGPFLLQKAHYKEAEWFKKSLAREFFISDVFLGLREKPHFIITVCNEINQVPWVLRTTIDFMAFNSIVENLRVGQTGFAFILNRKGEFQTKPRFDIVSSQSVYRDLLENRPERINEIQVCEKTDDVGTAHIYVASFLKNGDWLLVFQQNTDDAYASFKHAQMIAIVIFLLGGAAIVFIALWVSGRISRRLVRVDKEKEMMNLQVIETGKLASLGELSAGIAHEINNPVAIMSEEAGWIEDLLADKEDLPKNLEEIQRSLNQIRNQGRRCKEITHKLLSFARKTDANLHNVQVNEIIEEVICLSTQRAKYGNVTINTFLKNDLPTIQASKTELQQIFLNLINNALDAMEKTGGMLTISSDMESKTILITFEDTGPGIPEANISRIFDPFFTTKPVGKGTGLGLSICYGILKKMGGDIQVKSAVYQGTTFFLHIPINGNEERKR